MRNRIAAFTNLPLTSIDRLTLTSEAARHRRHGRRHRQGPAGRVTSAVTDLPRRLVAEALGSALLVATVVGSGIMAAALTTDGALALLGNTLPTGAILVVLITVLAPISGAHFNPAVTLVFALRRELPVSMALRLHSRPGAPARSPAPCSRTPCSSLPLLQFSARARPGQGSGWPRPSPPSASSPSSSAASGPSADDAVPWLVGLYITAAYWFTASTSFANPAVTLARALTDSFSGISRADAQASSLPSLSGRSLPPCSAAGCGGPTSYRRANA